MEEKSKPGEGQAPPTVKTLRTYEGDVRDTVAKEKVTLAKMAMAENERAGKTESIGDKLSPEKSESLRRLIIISVSFLLVAAGLGGVFFIINRQKVIEKTTEAARPELLVNVDSQYEITVPTLNRLSLLNALRRETYAPQTVGTVRAIFIKIDELKYLDGPEILSALESVLPARLSRSLTPQATVGIHVFDGNHLFLVFKTDSHDQTLAGLIEWEKDLAEKLVPLLSRRALLPSEKRPFADVIIKNIETRMLKDENGQPLLLYAFLDRETFVITDSTATLEEIGRRLRSVKLTR